MSDKIKVSATVLPRRIGLEPNPKTSREEYYLHVEVALNPYLTESKDSLTYYYEIMDWYKYREIFRQGIYFKFSTFRDDWKQLTVFADSLQGEQVPDEHVTEISSGAADAPVAASLWKSMFNEKTFVIGWNLDEIPYDVAAKLSSRELSEAIVGEIDRLIDEILTDPHRAPQDTSLAFYLTDLRKRTSLANEIVTDPILSASASRRLQRYYAIIKEYIDRYNAQLNDLYLDLSLREQKSRNVDNTAEFHKKFSGYSNHPFLLRETGWNWSYKINVNSVYKELLGAAMEVDCKPGTQPYRLFISIDNRDEKNYRKPLDDLRLNQVKPDNLLHNAFHFSFLDEVKFLYPHTALDLYKKEQDIRYAHVGRRRPTDIKEGEVFLELDPESGYVKIGEGATKHLYASVVDRHRFLERVEKQYKANQENAQNKVVKGEQDRQNRDLGEAIESEREAARKNFADGSGAEYTNNGITLSLENYDRVVDTTIRNTPDVPINDLKAAGVKQLEGTGILYLHNLVAGYRVDVAAHNTLKGEDRGSFCFGSLCQKEEHYYIRDRKGDMCIKFLGHEGGRIDEGWLGASAQASNSGKLYIDQELTNWNNWSLVCMRLGDNRSYINPPPEDGSSVLYIAVLPSEATMAPQRFGWTYSFALRPADICGGGPAAIHELINSARRTKLKAWLKGQTAEACIKNYWSDPILYQRVDAVPSPLIAFEHPVFKEKERSIKSLFKERQTDAPVDDIPEWRSERWGEDLLTMVIRSVVSEEELKISPEAPTTSRYAGPPHAGLDFVMQHGALDNLITTPSGPDLVASEEAIEKLRADLFRLANQKGEETVCQARQDDRDIDYLYDPLAQGLLIEPDTTKHSLDLDWGMFARAGSGARFTYLKQCYWKKGGSSTDKEMSQLFKITLAEKTPGGISSYAFSPGAEEGIATLQAGCQIGMQLGCLVSDKRGPTELFYPGVPKARRVMMQLVHAVQQPCLVKTTYFQTTRTFQRYITRAVLRLRRFEGRSEAVASISFEKFPVLTAESYHLHIQSIDLVSDKTSPLGYRFVKQQKIAKSNILPQDPDNELNVVFQNIEHAFGSTIHRHANYRIEAVSRYKKYYDPRKFAEQDAFSVYGILRQDFATTAFDGINDNTTVEEYNQFVLNYGWQVVISTKPPEKPMVEKIVPLFDWVVNKDETICERFCNRVRIYLDDWHSSGVNEKLAVFFLSKEDARFRFSSKNVLYLEKNKEPKSLQGVLSQYGLDPASGEGGALEVIDEDFFDLSVGSHAILREIPLSDLCFAKTNGDDTNYFKDLKIKAVTYDVGFINKDDVNRQRRVQYGENTEQVTEGKYYVDIVIKHKHVASHYFPFLRLAIARYQEHSLPVKPGTSSPETSPYFRFSEVVLTDFVQLPPYRRVVFKEDVIEYHTSIAGDVAGGVPRKTNNVLVVLAEQKEKVDNEQIYNISGGIAGNEMIKVYKIMKSGMVEIKDYKGSFRALNLLEYENYGTGDPTLHHDYADAPSECGDDIRNDHKKRLIFSYTKKLF